MMQTPRASSARRKRVCRGWAPNLWPYSCRLLKPLILMSREQVLKTFCRPCMDWTMEEVTASMTPGLRSQINRNLSISCIGFFWLGVTFTFSGIFLSQEIWSCTIDLIVTSPRALLVMGAETSTRTSTWSYSTSLSASTSSSLRFRFDTVSLLWRRRRQFCSTIIRSWRHSVHKFTWPFHLLQN